MARHWLHWVVGGGVSNRPSSAARRRSSTRISGDADADAPGCMCAVFQLFDLNHHHHHPFTFHHHANRFLQDEAISSKGVEAPRNSLEIEEPSPIKQVEENLTLPVGIQIKTRISNEGSKSRTEDIPGIDSPSAKTPNLVARLMGLDLLPDQCTSPSNSSTPQRKHMMRRNVVLLQTIRSSSNNNNRCFSFSEDDITVGTRSLPETPRISSARRSDSDYHIRSRHTLQNSNKENTCHQIVKQAKESTVGRRVGLNDITNNRSHETIVRRDQNLVLLKPTKKSSRPSEISTKLGFSDTKKNEQRATRTASSGDHSSDYQRRVILNSMKPKKHQSVIQEHRRVPQQQNCGKKVNMMMETKKKKKKAPPLLSNEILNISGPILLPVKKDPSPPATKLPQKQMQSQVSDALSSKRNTQTLSSNTSRSYTHLHLQPINKISTVLPDKHNGCATAVSAAAAAAAEYNTYVQKILKRTGINDNITPLALGKWHTPSHPLDPSIYYYLELFHPSTASSSSSAASGVLSRRCNRKLIFQLVDELLAEILRPHLDFKPWVVSPPLPPINNGDDRPGLVDEICKRIGSFPAANCVVLEDIDSLIDGDLCIKWRLKGFFDDGGERLVREIEGEIVEELVRDTVAAMVGVRTAEERNRDRSG